MLYEILQAPAIRSFTKREKRRIDLLLIHATAGKQSGDVPTLQGRTKREVSVHYYINKFGHILQIVQDNDIAWHAGASSWEGETDLNQFSLGIELENLNTGGDPYPRPQLDAVTWLAQRLVAKHNIKASRIVRHLDVSPGRKTDPAGFPWDTWKASVAVDPTLLRDWGGNAIYPPSHYAMPTEWRRQRDAGTPLGIAMSQVLAVPDGALQAFEQGVIRFITDGEAATLR